MEPRHITMLHCPRCGFAKTETMPEDRCIVVYPCTSCGVVLRPKAGDCCVFCSYAEDKCPPMQQGTSECAG